MRVFIVSQYPAAKRGNQPENAMTKEEAKKKQLLAAYAWGRHSAAAPECFALDPDKLVALCALGVMPPKVEKGAGSTPATGSAGNGVSVGEQPAVTCVATTTNTMSAGEKTAGAKHTPAPWVRGGGFGPRSTAVTTTSGRHIAAVETWGVKHPDERAKYEDLHAWWPEGEANLNLIAAAPDLLEALKDLVECDCAAYGLDAANCEHARARAAIARAEGGE